MLVIEPIDSVRRLSEEPKPSRRPKHNQPKHNTSTFTSVDSGHRAAHHRALTRPSVNNIAIDYALHAPAR